MAALFPPQNRDWALPSEANLSPKAAERICRESAQKTFDEAAKSLNLDWNTTLDGKQLQRWSEALGRGMVAERDHRSQAYREGRYPQGPANAPQLLVIGMDGGRWQAREKNADTDSRWREDKVLTVSSYVPGDGLDRKPASLVRTQVATSRDAAEFGTMARVEAERRGYRQAQTVIALGEAATGSSRCWSGTFASRPGSSTGITPASICGIAPRRSTARRRRRRRRWPSGWRPGCGMGKSRR